MWLRTSNESALLQHSKVMLLQNLFKTLDPGSIEYIKLSVNWCFLNSAIPDLYFFTLIFLTVSSKYVDHNFATKAGIELWTSGVGSNCSTNCVTTTDNILLKWLFRHGSLYLKRTRWLARYLPHSTISWVVFKNKISAHWPVWPDGKIVFQYLANTHCKKCQSRFKMLPNTNKPQKYNQILVKCRRMWSRCHWLPFF